MPLLAAFLGSAFTTILSFFAAIMTKKIAMIAALILFLVGTTTIFYATINGLVSGVSYVVPSELSNAFGMFMPDNTTAVLSVMLTARIARYVYDTNLSIAFAKV